MDTSRIATLLAPFLGLRSEIGGCTKEPAVLSATQLQNISTYIDILQRWNARVNLTAIRDEEEIVTRHFGESLFAARHLFPREDREGHGLSRAANVFEKDRASVPEATVADIGSGPGFPGIPIKLWAPEISLTLIESNHKKATFLREVARSLTLTNVNIQNARAESLAGTSFDVVTLRAVERFETILPVAASLLAPQGRLALLIGSAQVAQAHASVPNLHWLSPCPMPNSCARLLLVAQLCRAMEPKK